MDVIIARDAHNAAESGAGLIAATFADRSSGVIGLATGSSPLPLYEAWSRRASQGEDYSRLHAFALDEYVGIPVEDPQSYHATILRVVVEPVGLTAANVHLPDGMSADLEAAAHEYEVAISVAGGIDLQILGIGTNGHLGFNEPGTALDSRTHVEKLTQETRSSNARFFGDSAKVPERCVTQGIGTILEARHLLLIASGERKAIAVARALEGPISSDFPASVLQLHGRVTVLLDEAAAGRLTKAQA